MRFKSPRQSSHVLSKNSDNPWVVIVTVNQDIVQFVKNSIVERLDVCCAFGRLCAKQLQISSCNYPPKTGYVQCALSQSSVSPHGTQEQLRLGNKMKCIQTCRLYNARMTHWKYPLAHSKFSDARCIFPRMAGDRLVTGT